MAQHGFQLSEQNTLPLTEPIIKGLSSTLETWLCIPSPGLHFFQALVHSPIWAVSSNQRILQPTHLSVPQGIHLPAWNHLLRQVSWKTWPHSKRHSASGPMPSRQMGQQPKDDGTAEGVLAAGAGAGCGFPRARARRLAARLRVMARATVVQSVKESMDGDMAAVPSCAVRATKILGLKEFHGISKQSSLPNVERS